MKGGVILSISLALVLVAFGRPISRENLPDAVNRVIDSGVNNIKHIAEIEKSQETLNPNKVQSFNIGLKRKNYASCISSGIKEAYEGKVGMSALLRAGRNKNLKGIVHEYRYINILNFKNLMNGTRAVLTKSTIAIRDDILLIKNGRVIGRFQLKDTVSSVGTTKTIKQVLFSKYWRTKLLGTKETVNAYNLKVAKINSNGTKITQKMHSTGLSSVDNARIADQALGSAINKQAITSAAKSYGTLGAVVSGAVEFTNAGSELLNGEIHGFEFAERVAKETAGGYVSGAAGGVAGTVTTSVAAKALVSTSAPLWIAPTIGVCAAITFAMFVKCIFDNLLL